MLVSCVVVSDLFFIALLLLFLVQVMMLISCCCVGVTAPIKRNHLSYVVFVIIVEQTHISCFLLDFIHGNDLLIVADS